MIDNTLDLNLFSVTKSKLKHVSASRGGYAVVPSPTEVGKFVIIKISKSAAKHFKSKYYRILPEIEYNLISYNNVVVAITAHDVTGHLSSLKNMKNDIDYKFDGERLYYYNFENTGDLTHDGFLKWVQCYSISITKFFTISVAVSEVLSINFDGFSIAVYVTVNGEKTITTPIKSSLDRWTMNEKLEDISINKAVNLQFILSAANIVSEIFDFETIEPLNIPDLMCRLETVNIQYLDTAVKMTVDTGHSIINIVSWIMGLIYRCDREKQIGDKKIISDLITKLFTTGQYLRQSISSENIFQNGFNSNNIPKINIDEIDLNEISKMSITGRLSSLIF